LVGFYHKLIFNTSKNEQVNKQQLISKVLEIDLGTTNSYVAVVEGGSPVVIANAEGFRTHHSIAGNTKSDEKL